MNTLYDVVIVGGGPIGLLLACELALMGVSVLVLEREFSSQSTLWSEPLGWRAMNAASSEILYRRGLLEQFSEIRTRGKIIDNSLGSNYAGTFAGFILDGNKFDRKRWKYFVPSPGLVPGLVTVEHMVVTLTARARSMGVTILRGIRVTKILAQDNRSVTIGTEEGQTFCGRFLVGCDGGQSVMRKAAGFDFVGTGPKLTGYALILDLANPEKLNAGFNLAQGGLYARIYPGTMHLLGFDGGTYDRTQTVTSEHIQSVVDRVAGTTGVKVTAVHHVAVFTDRCKQVISYRKGRILLAGDAAHIHAPIGGQGMNLGVGEAINLGWKLAATVRHELETERNGKMQPTNFSLLDTYGSERLPVTTSILDFTRAQVSIMQPEPAGSALKSFFGDLLATTDGSNLMIGYIWGISLQYNIEGHNGIQAHPLMGRSAPDFEFKDGSRLGPMLTKGHALLVDFGSCTALQDLLEMEGEKTQCVQVDYVRLEAKDELGVAALLVRPDGIVAWAMEADVAQPDMEAAKAAIERWFTF